jgi:hypothetical protein
MLNLKEILCTTWGEMKDSDFDIHVKAKFIIANELDYMELKDGTILVHCCEENKPNNRYVSLYHDNDEGNMPNEFEFIRNVPTFEGYSEDGMAIYKGVQL